MMHNISSLHYITQDLADLSHQDQVKQACEAGIDWVQLRIKSKSEEEWLKIAKNVKIICNQYNAKLIINDNTRIAKLVGADGVHLGKSDMSITEARKLLGENFIIGGTANTFDDIKKLINDGADYIGLGPFRFTVTKENLSPTLGLKGYKNILSNLENATPIIGIGGIKIDDIQDLINTGLYGVAISSAINKSGNIALAVKNFQNEIEKVKKNEQISYSRKGI